VDQLLHQLGPARLSMVILDACRNNPFERRFRGAGGGLAQIDAPTGTLLAYATAPGKVAADGTGSNGLYTEALLKALDLPGLKVEDIFKQVRINVVKASDGQQTPWESSSLTGEFYFTPDNKPALADEKLKQSEKERAELAKALDEERRKRDKDSELVRAEMEKLRAELLKIRTDVRATQSAAAPQVAENDKTQREERTRAEAERKRLNALAIAEPEATKEQVLAQAEQTASAASTTGTKVNSPPAIVAMIAPAGSAPTTVDELPLRIALLEKLHGQLTFTKAISLLLDITSTENLIQVTLLEKILQDGGFANALAIGMNAQGNAVWAGTARFRNIPFAEESALESCAKAPDTSCKVVLANGTFREKVFLEWALQLRGSNLMHLRETFLKSVAASPNEMRTFGGGLGNSGLNVAKLFTPNLSLR
ncbi:MAG: caspase family protein, partial [Rhodocyclales bacterium]|nr:caspase family protein [Rhodocyclales bacterium]